ncbi:MAG: hypothetical protein MJK04_05505, partial [Psychrosphaera sp.]|nr:hypothetical protein [Psychrosphaera sp.]
MDKLLLKTVLLLISLLVWGQPLAATIGPISAEKLFANPQFDDVKISPDGTLVSSYFYNDKGRYVGVIDLKTNTFRHKLSIGLDNNLLGHSWLDTDQIFIELGTDKGSKYLIIDLKPKVKMNLIEADGYLVDDLPDQSDKVMYAKRHSKYSRYFDLYIITVEALKKNDFE